MFQRPTKLVFIHSRVAASEGTIANRARSTIATTVHFALVGMQPSITTGNVHIERRQSFIMVKTCAELGANCRMSEQISLAPCRSPRSETYIFMRTANTRSLWVCHEQVFNDGQWRRYIVTQFTISNQWIGATHDGHMQSSRSIGRTHILCVARSAGTEL